MRCPPRLIGWQLDIANPKVIEPLIYRYREIVPSLVGSYFISMRHAAFGEWLNIGKDQTIRVFYLAEETNPGEIVWLVHGDHLHYRLVNRLIILL